MDKSEGKLWVNKMLIYIPEKIHYNGHPQRVQEEKNMPHTESGMVSEVTGGVDV